MKAEASICRFLHFRRSPKVLVVSIFSWHDAILGSLVTALKKWTTVQYIAIEKLIKEQNPELQPKVVVVCDAGHIKKLRKYFPDSLFLHVGHGLISKNQPADHYKEADYVCVASSKIAERFESRGIKPRKRYLATGLIQSDALFSVKSESRRAFHSVTGTKIVYAPTWNESLSSADMFGGNLVVKLRGDDHSISILIKPHPHIKNVRPEWLEMWRAMAESSLNVHFIDGDSDLIPALVAADLLVSDASSAIFHFLALNRPIVLVDNPMRFKDLKGFDPNGIEWLWRDIGANTEDVDSVKDLIVAELENPSSREEARLSRRNELFGELVDGKACDRVNEAIKVLIAKGEI